MKWVYTQIQLGMAIGANICENVQYFVRCHSTCNSLLIGILAISLIYSVIDAIDKAIKITSALIIYSKGVRLIKSSFLLKTKSRVGIAEWQTLSSKGVPIVR